MKFLHALSSRIWTSPTLAYLINVLHILLISWKIPTCTALFHPARLFILGNFKPKPLFLLMKNEKFLPARPYSNLHVYYFLEFFPPARLFHPARLLDRLEYMGIQFWFCMYNLISGHIYWEYMWAQFWFCMYNSISACTWAYNSSSGHTIRVLAYNSCSECTVWVLGVQFEFWAYKFQFWAYNEPPPAVFWLWLFGRWVKWADFFLNLFLSTTNRT